MFVDQLGKETFPGLVYFYESAVLESGGPNKLKV